MIIHKILSSSSVVVANLAVEALFYCGYKAIILEVLFWSLKAVDLSLRGKAGCLISFQTSIYEPSIFQVWTRYSFLLNT